MTFEWCEYPDREHMYAALAELVGTGLRDILRQAPAAGLVASGGTTPRPLYRRLSGAELDWDRVRVTLTDERWVGPEDPASNEKMLREDLLSGPAQSARFIPIYEGTDTPEAAERSCAERLSAMPWSSSLCLLGMGRDGHCASLFPGAAGLDDAIDPGFDGYCKAIRPVSTDVAGPYARMSLTLATLLRTRHIYLLLAGEEKRDTFRRAQQGSDQREMPVRAVLRQDKVPVSVCWAP